jgi:acyl-coenzyme A thioesterase PaaI-like protein
MQNDDREYLPHSSGCFLCGEENLSGVRARFFVAENEVRGTVRIPRHMNGYKSVAHGGVLAALLDETMGWAATVFGRRHPMFVTAELTVRYLCPVPVEEEILVRSRLVKDVGRLAMCEGELLLGPAVCVRAKGKFSPLSREGTADVLPYLRFHDCRRFRTLFDDYR